jgi:hypothetical protein
LRLFFSAHPATFFFTESAVAYMTTTLLPFVSTWLPYLTAAHTPIAEGSFGGRPQDAISRDFHGLRRSYRSLLRIAREVTYD